MMNARDSNKVTGRNVGVMVRFHSNYRIARSQWFHVDRNISQVTSKTTHFHYI